MIQSSSVFYIRFLAAFFKSLKCVEKLQKDISIFSQTYLTNPAPLARKRGGGGGLSLGQKWGLGLGDWDLQGYDVVTAVDKILRWGSFYYILKH